MKDSIEILKHGDLAYRVICDTLGFEPPKNKAFVFSDDSKEGNDYLHYSPDKDYWCIKNFASDRCLSSIDVFMFKGKYEFAEALKTLEAKYLNGHGGHHTHGNGNGHAAKPEKPFQPPVLRAVKEFTPAEVAYWQQFGITGKVLKTFGVYAVDVYFDYSFDKGRNNWYGYQVKPSEKNGGLVFAYKLSDACFKIYRPLHPDKLKRFLWLGEKPGTFNEIWGLDMIPENTETILVTEGLKDALSINSHLECFGRNLWALAKENAKNPLDTITIAALKSRHAVLLCLDADKAGKEATAKYATAHGLRSIDLEGFITDDLGYEVGPQMKDLSDIFKLAHSELKEGETVADFQPIFAGLLSKALDMPEPGVKPEPEKPQPSSVFTRISDEWFGWLFFRWEIVQTDKGAYLKGPRLWRDGIIDYCAAQGFCKMYEGVEYTLLRKQSNIVEEVGHALIRDACTPAVTDIGEVYEGFVVSSKKGVLSELLKEGQHTIFNHKFLGLLPNLEGEFLKDTPETCFFPFQDFILAVEAGRSYPVNYQDINRNVWKKTIIPRAAPTSQDGENSIFAAFCVNIGGQNLSALQTGMGYMLHNHKDPAATKAVFLVDYAPPADMEPNGGTGKGLIAQALSQMRKLTLLDGKIFDPENRFCFSLVGPETRIVFLDDVRSGFNSDFLNTILTEGFTVERKNQNQIFIPPSEAPKFLISSNYAVDGRGTTRKRRQHVVELADFYSRQTAQGEPFPVRKTHGCTFFSTDWDEQEWSRFDGYMIGCTQKFLADGLAKPVRENAKLRFFMQSAGSVFAQWAIERYGVPEGGKRRKTSEYSTRSEMDEFVRSAEKEIKKARFHELMRLYAEAENCTFSERRSNSIEYFSLISR